jgi:peptidyl-prolyl cis-trans isomerase C
MGRKETMRACILTIAFASALLAQAPPQLLQAPLGPDTVVAAVAGINVTIADIEKMLVGAPQQAAQSLQQNPQGTIQQLFLMRHLAEEGEKAKLGELSPYKEQLEFARASVLANLMLNQQRDGYTVTGEDIEKFYKLNESRWTQAKIKIIFIGFKPSAPAAAKAGLKPEDIADAARQAFNAAHSPSDRSEEEASKLASDLVQQLRTGADFVKLVAQYSDDSSSKGNAGDFGSPVTPTSSFSDDFKKSILALKQGEISDPLKQPNGFYIVRVEEKSVQALNSVREPIIQELRKTHLDEFMKELSSRYQPSVLRPDFFLQPGRYLAAAAAAPAPPPPAPTPKP